MEIVLNNTNINEKVVSVRFGFSDDVSSYWGITESNKIVIGINGFWEFVPGAASSVANGPAGVFHNAPGNDQVWQRTGISSNNPKGSSWVNAVC